MKVSWKQLLISIVASLIVAFLSCTIVKLTMPPEDYKAAQLASFVGIGVMGLTMIWFSFAGTQPASVMLGSGLRVIATICLGALVAKLNNCWGNVYFLVLVVMYLSTLALETWIVMRSLRAPNQTGLTR